MRDEPYTPNDLPKTHDRYILVRKIAEGGSAVVHLAWDDQDRQYRAIKVLQSEFAKKPALKNRFEREGRTMMQLDHPNIIKVFDAVNDDDSAYLVMEFAEGGSVIEWLERNGRGMPARMAAQIGLELCAGIQAAHEQGVVHRDIKPHNLLLDRNGRCKVTDFGIAQAVLGPRMTMTGTVMGTVGYMAPEQHESAKHADERADIYSIAATLFTLVAGEAQHHLFMAEDHEYEKIPAPLAEVIRKGSQFRREARYRTVAEMAVALRRALDKLPADPPNTPPLLPPDMEVFDSRPPRATGLRRKGQNLLAVDSLPSAEPVGNLRVRTDSDGKTPSSIIPRHSLTGPIRERSRRPQIRSREEMIRQERMRTLRQAAVATMLLGLVLGAVLAAIGWWRIDANVRAVNDAQKALIHSVTAESKLPEKVTRANPDDAQEMSRLFEQIQTENDPHVREGAVERLLNLMDRSLESFQGSQGLEDALRQTESARKNVKGANEAYKKRQQELKDAETGVMGWLACHVFAAYECNQDY